MDSRKKLFKKVFDGDSCRRRREEQQVQIRKQKREDSLSQRRRMDNDSQSTVPAATNYPAAGSFGTSVGLAAGGANLGVPQVEDLPRFALDMRSGDAAREVEATRGVRKLLSVERKPPVEEVLAQNILPLLVGLLDRDGAPTQLQFEAAWALTNIASTSFTRALVVHGAIPPLTRLLLSPSADVREQCAWALGNVSGDCPELRDMVLQHGALRPLLQNVLAPASESMLRNCIWSLSNLCRGKPQPHVDLLRPALPVLAQVLASSSDPECLQDTAWALSYISDGDGARIQAVLDAGVASDLVKHLTHPLPNVVTPVVRALGNLVSGDDEHTQAVIDAGALTCMPSLLRNCKKNIRKETCWLLSNIAAGNRQQVHALATTQALVKAVLTQMSQAEWEVRKEAAWVVSNVATGGSGQHVHMLVELGVLKPLSDLLDAADVKVIEVALDALEAILKVWKTGVPLAHGECDYMVLLQEADLHERLEKLQEHASEKIYRRAVDIIENYLGVEEEEELGDKLQNEFGQGMYGFQAAAPVGASNKGFDFSSFGH